MFGWFPFRIRLVHLPGVRPPGWVPPLKRRKRLALTAVVVAAVAGGSLSAIPASAGSSGSLAATITVVTFSVTVSPTSATYGLCTGGNSSTGALGFPNGECALVVTGGVTVTNTSTASTAHIDVNGADAVPSDNGTHWKLTGTLPGIDQYFEETNVGLGLTVLTNSPQCDNAFNPNNFADRCAASPNQVGNEVVSITGPSSSTDSSTTFTTTVTWTAVP